MYSKLHSAIQFLHYYITAGNGKGHGMHSPFVYDFITKVLNDKKQYPEYEKAETLRRQLMADETLLAVDDMGAGSAVTRSRQRSVSSIARFAAKPPKFAQLLFRMARYYKPVTIIELGTSLGITTSYLAMASPGTLVTTMEGAGTVAETAAANFKKLGLDNTEIITGNFDDTLGRVLEAKAAAGFVFVDGNHRREPTERYFSQLLQYVNNDSILIFDDIHWSREMEQAWDSIRGNPAVRCSVDLFFIGIVFFRQEFREKQHFIIRF